VHIILLSSIQNVVVSPPNHNRNPSLSIILTSPICRLTNPDEKSTRKLCQPTMKFGSGILLIMWGHSALMQCRN